MSGPTLSSEYASPTPLQVRIETHARYSEHPDDPVAAVTAVLGLSGEESIADIGCGDGRFLAHIAQSGHRGRLIGVDTSPAMVAAAGQIPGVEAVPGDAGRLPFADRSICRTTARHMLYHVPHPVKALREFRRITSSGGMVAVTVNHPQTCSRTRELVSRRAHEYGLVPVEELSNTVNSDTLPELMTEVFPDVQVHRFDNALVFDRPEPLVRLAEAVFSFCGIDTNNPHRPDILAAVTTDIEDWFAGHPGEIWRDPKGYIIATATVE